MSHPSGLERSNFNSDPNKLIIDFSENVDRLHSSESWIFLSKIFRISSPETKKNVKNVIKQAAEIIKFLPENCSEKGLKKLLKDKKWKPEGISRENIEIFYKNCHYLFQNLFPMLRNSPYKGKDKMPLEVQHFLDPEIFHLRQEKQTDPLKVNDPDHRIKRKVAKGKLAYRLGHGSESNLGTTGSLRIKDVNRKVIGIFKVDSSEVSILRRITNFIKANFWGQLRYLSHKYMAQPLAEKAAYILDRQLGFEFVPASTEGELRAKAKVKRGVFQIFVRKDKAPASSHYLLSQVKIALNKVHDYAKMFSLIDPYRDETEYVSFHKVMNQWNNKKEFTPKEIDLVHKFFILDRLMMNLDRHEENWLVTLSKGGEITNIKAIDNANAFPVKIPAAGSIAVRNQYKWRNLKIATMPFSDATRELVQEKFTPAAISGYVDAITLGAPNFLGKEMAELIAESGAHILKIINTKGSIAGDIAETL